MRLFLFLSAICLVLIVTGSAALALKACGVTLPFGLGAWSACRTAPDYASLDRLAALKVERGDLRARISVLENDLGKIQCEADAQTPPASVPATIDKDAFQRRDLAALSGCWQLMTQFDVRNARTGKSTTYDRWAVCFEPDGTGTEVLTATDGTTCEGPVAGAFDTSGSFEISKPGKLDCSDGTFIYKTQASCNLDGAGRAICDLYQPETGGTDRVELRRGTQEP
ncbi:hypothetical protein [Tropicimonas sp. IMCC34043]|uniref:hypothetical protein n=1 Tax=Tropicimonas sp. IMCC34043 TaxID=2248760 RepID=UPI000E26392A|nr:hypothetical protein [Tropicimonas sp. IMCC34043]